MQISGKLPSSFRVSVVDVAVVVKRRVERRVCGFIFIVVRRECLWCDE